MRYQYRIYHSEKSKSPVDRFFHPYTASDALREYQLFPSSLAHFFDDPAIVASCVPASPETNGVIVTLVTELLEDEAGSALERLLISLNSQIPGPCLVVEKI